MTAGVYIASRAVHAPKWRGLRERGLPVASTWIDEAGSGETRDWSDLAARCIREAVGCRALLLYMERGELLKGALMETGAALGAGRPVVFVGPEDHHHTLVRNHPGVVHARDMHDGICRAAALLDLVVMHPSGQDLSWEDAGFVSFPEYRRMIGRKDN